MALGLGGNLRDTETHLRRAIESLRSTLDETRVASLYLTEPVSAIRQPPFLNTAVTGRTCLSPENLLALLKLLEWRAGRRPARRFAPRPLDIDILIYGDLERRSSALTIPHAQLRNRLFYLAPLAEIAPALKVPPDGATIGELARSTEARGEVRVIDWSSSAPPISD